VLEWNIRALQLGRQREEKEATAKERVAEAITRFTGSMPVRLPAPRLLRLLGRGRRRLVPGFCASDPRHLKARV
jgi:hypothetical protein